MSKRKTEPEKFFNDLRELGFITVDNFSAHRNIESHHYRDADGTHYLPFKIHLVNFQGTDTIKGSLGCVCMYYVGHTRRKNHRTSEISEILKHVIVPSSSDQALAELQSWLKASEETIKTWTIIL